MVSGFKEIQHTADWALEIWAPDFPGLVVQAALGMNWLMGLKFSKGPVEERTVILTAFDDESLLISFLNNILYELDLDNLGFENFNIVCDGRAMTVRMTGTRLTHFQRVIKAVTFHNLKISRSDNGLTAQIVFDV